MAAKKRTSTPARPAPAPVFQIPQMTAEEIQAAAGMALGQAPTAQAATGVVTPAPAAAPAPAPVSAPAVAPAPAVAEPAFAAADFVAAARMALGQPATAEAAIGRPAPVAAPQEPASPERAAAEMALGQPATREAATGQPAQVATITPPTVITPPEAVTPTPETTLTPPPVPTPPQQTTPAPAAPSPDAVELLKNVLRDYNLEGLADEAYGFLVRNPGASSEAFLESLRKNKIYTDRFAGNAQRKKAGLPEYTPAEYVAAENGYRAAFQFYGVPTSFYDETADFQKLIEGNVDVVELRDRIAGGYAAVAQASPDVVKQLKELYDIDEPKLAAYFLDPAKGKQMLQRQAEAAKVSATAKQASGIQLTSTTAERLAAENISPEGVRAGFTQIGQERQLYRPAVGEDVITQQEQIEGTFGLNAAARQRIESRRRRRTAAFEAGGGFAETQQGVVGLRQVGQ